MTGNVLNPLTVQVGLGGVWYTSLFVGLFLTLLGLLFFTKFSKLAPLSLRVLYGYCAISALFILEYPALHFGPYTVAYKAAAGQSLIEFSLIPMAAFLIEPYLEKVLTGLVAFTLLCVAMGWPGLLGASSFNLAFTALSLPFLPPYLGFVVLAVILFHHSNTAVLVVLAMFGVTLIKKNRSGKLSWALIPALALSAIYHTHVVSSIDERWAHYKEYMTYWAGSWKQIILGVGPGSFTPTSLMIDQYRAPLFLQMHSDWLQLTFCFGLVGLSLALWVYIEAIRRARGNLNLLAAVVGFGVFALTYHPLQYFPSALLSACIFARAFSLRLS